MSGEMQEEDVKEKEQHPGVGILGKEQLRKPLLNPVVVI